MSDNIAFRLVDAFAETPFTGNPAGVVLDADGLTDEQMQLIAREVNASETAFLLNTHDLHAPSRIRWFSPTQEVRFCGHATIAAAHASSEVVGFRTLIQNPDAKVEFASTAGLLRLRPETIPERATGLLWWLPIPDVRLTPDNSNPMKLTRLLGMSLDDLEPSAPIMRTADHDVILLVQSWRRLMELQPDSQELAAFTSRHGIRGVCVATRETTSEFIHVTSRFFAPAVGIPEDPVTGSVHGPLGVLLVVHGLAPVARGRATLHCIQGIPGGRSGVVRVFVESGDGGYSASVGGLAHTVLTGEMRVPDVEKAASGVEAQPSSFVPDASQHS